MATMKIGDSKVLLGVNAGMAKNAGAVELMQPTHGGFRTEGLALGHVKRISKHWPASTYWITKDLAVAGPNIGQPYFGVWVGGKEQ